MGLSQLLSKEGREARALSKACAKAANHLIKPDDRKPALFLLAENGSDEAIAGLLSRLCFNYTTNTVSDEEEKQFVFETLREMGGKTLPELKKHLRAAPSLSWGLRLLEKVCDQETCWSVLTEILTDYDPEYERDPSRKLQLLTFIGELNDDRVTGALLPFIEDHDETVRYVVVDALFKQADEAACREPLLRILTDADEESLRIKNRIAEGFSELEWVVKGYRGAVERQLGELGGVFSVDGRGHIRRKKVKA